MPKTYSDSGVHIKEGDDTSESFHESNKLTWVNREGKVGEVIIPFDEFRSVRGIDISSLPEGTIAGMEFDGVGTKIDLAERVGDYTTIAFDNLAMNTEDVTAKGGEPILFGSILDVRSLKENSITYRDKIDQLRKGSVLAAQEAGVAIINGETAELGDRVGGYGSPGHLSELAHKYIIQNLNQNNQKSIKYLSSYVVEKNENMRINYFDQMSKSEREFVKKLEKMRTLNCNWGGAVFWIAQKDRMLTGNMIQKGDTLVGLEEKGFRSNGLTLLRETLEEQHGVNWHEVIHKGETLGRQALEPSRIYTKAILEMTGGYDREPGAEVHGIAHTTGGGIPSKLGGVLKPRKLGAYIHNPLEPCDLMLYCQEIGNISDEEAYKTWNMGQGMIVVTPHARRVRDIAGDYDINSDIIGTVTDEPEIRIKSRGYHSPGEIITF